MNTPMQQWPAFVVAGGPEAGRVFTLGPGSRRIVLGRGADADVVVDHSSVSRHHAAVSRSEKGVTVEDLGSTNGTSVNETRLSGRADLEPGDRLFLGEVCLQFGVIGMPTQRAGEGPVSTYDFGDVHGPVNAGSGAMNVGSGQQYVAAGNIHHGDKIDVTNDYDPWDEAFQGTGPGRVLLVLGSIVALAGFGLWMALIFSGFSVDDASDTTPFDREFRGIPLFAIGFTLFAGGGVLAGIGSGMSKSGAQAGGAQPGPARRLETEMSDTFRFGNVSGPVNAGSGNLNVGSGSQFVAGGDLNLDTRVGSDPQAAQQIETLREMIAGLRLTPAEREGAEHELGALAEAGGKKSAAQHLEAFVVGLQKADAAASGASSFVESVTKLVNWIGPVAVGVLALL